MQSHVVIDEEPAGVDFVSPPVPAQYATRGSLIITIKEATPFVGEKLAVITLEVSNQPPLADNQQFQPASLPSRWVALASVDILDNGNVMIPFTEFSNRWVRVRYQKVAAINGTVIAELVLQGWA